MPNLPPEGEKTITNTSQTDFISIYLLYLCFKHSNLEAHRGSRQNQDSLKYNIYSSVDFDSVTLSCLTHDFYKREPFSWKLQKKFFFSSFWQNYIIFGGFPYWIIIIIIIISLYLIIKILQGTKAMAGKGNFWFEFEPKHVSI